MISHKIVATFLVVATGAVICSTEKNVGQYQKADSPTAPDSQGARAHLQKRSPAYDFGLGKRAYSYVSEFKRLPVYNFGLGKRSMQYSFGLGKRSADADDFNAVDDDLDDNLDWLDHYDDDVSGLESKRARPYSFGLGKRRTYEFGLGKRRTYEFGLGKRDSAPEAETSDAEKRRAYEFGLGKRYYDGAGREEDKRRAYEFGLGKRFDLEDERASGKRRAYEFGLGKRASLYNFGLGKRLSGFGLGKREREANRFNFGLGKRSTADNEISDIDNLYDTAINSDE